MYEIKWTLRAVKDLHRIYQFYYEQIGEEKAFGLVQLIIEKVGLLSDKRFSRMGAIDKEFIHLKREYRKLIIKNIKATYRLSDNQQVIYINRVFDTRQNPGRNK